MHFLQIRSLKYIVFLPILMLLSGEAALAELVTFRFSGEAEVTVSGTFFDSEAFDILVAIDASTPDQMDAFFQPNIGAFSGATTTVSIPGVGIFDAQSSNVTGIAQRNTGGGSQFELVNPGNFFNPVLRVQFGDPDVIPDVNSINALLDPGASPVNFSSGGLDFLFANDPSVQINSVLSLNVSSVVSSATVPEPTSFMMMGIGLVGISLRRRRR